MVGTGCGVAHAACQLAARVGEGRGAGGGGGAAGAAHRVLRVCAVVHDAIEVQVEVVELDAILTAPQHGAHGAQPDEAQRQGGRAAGARLWRQPHTGFGKEMSSVSLPASVSCFSSRASTRQRPYLPVSHLKNAGTPISNGLSIYRSCTSTIFGRRSNLPRARAAASGSESAPDPPVDSPCEI